MSWMVVLVFFTTSAVPQARSGERTPSYVIEDARPTAELPVWESDVPSSMDIETADSVTTAVEDDIEAESARLESDLQKILPPVAPVSEPAVADDREVLFTFAASREFAPTSSTSTPAHQVSATGLSAAPDAGSMEHEPRIELRAEKNILPGARLSRLSDERLRRLCRELKDASHLTLETVSGATIRNYRQELPLLMKMGRLQEVDHLRASFVAFVGQVGARIRRLKNVKSPHLLCDVRLSTIQDVQAPVIVVGAKPPPALAKNPHVRWVSPEDRQALQQP